MDRFLSGRDKGNALNIGYIYSSQYIAFILEKEIPFQSTISHQFLVEHWETYRDYTQEHDHTDTEIYARSFIGSKDSSEIDEEYFTEGEEIHHESHGAKNTNIPSHSHREQRADPERPPDGEHILVWEMQIDPGACEDEGVYSNDKPVDLRENARLYTGEVILRCEENKWC